jgi:hypothetical protein
MSDGPIIHWAAEALLPRPPIIYIVEGVFPEGSVSVIFGEPGSKKTYSMLDAGVCVALGQDWLEFSTTQVPVLFIDEESGIQRMNKRLKAIMQAHNATENLKFAYVVLEGFNLLVTGDRTKLHDLVKATEAKFVVLDALADFLPGDENSVKDVLPGLRALRYIANDTKAAIVLIHHAGKSGHYRGSSSIKGAVDLMLNIQSRPGSPNIDFSCEKSRDVEPFSFAAVINFEEDSVNLTPSISKNEREEPNNVERFILEFLEVNGNSKITDICEAAEAAGVCKTETARKALYGSACWNKIERKDQGGPGSKAVYGLRIKGRRELLDLLESVG